MKMTLILASAVGVLSFSSVLPVIGQDGAGAAPTPTTTSAASEPAPAKMTSERGSGSIGGDLGLTFDIVPAAILFNVKADDFDVRGSDQSGVGFAGPDVRQIATSGSRFEDEEEEEMTLISTVPALSVGMTYERPSGYLDLRAGGGALLNHRLMSWMVFGTGEYLFEVRRSMFLGPRVGVGYFFEPEWWGDADISLDDAPAFSLGMNFEMGDKIAYLLSCEYYSFAFDVNGVGPGWYASDDEIDMSGIAVQFGLRMHL